MRVNQSQVKNKLYVGNLPRGMTQFQVEEELKQLVVGKLVEYEITKGPILAHLAVQRQ